MGRHEAGDGATVHPLVAAALAGRPDGAGGGTPRHAPGRVPAPVTAQDGALGWPGDPRDGRGLGWPADDSAPVDDAAASLADAPAETPAARPRRGWRRLFGSTAA